MSEDGSKERFKAVDVWVRSQMSPRVDDRRGDRLAAGGQIDRAELVRGCAECLGNGFVLLRFARARRVDEASTWRDHLSGPPEHLELNAGKRGQLGLAAPPPNVRIPAQRAQTGTRRIDEHAVKTLREGKGRQQIGLHEVNVGRTASGHGSSEEIHSSAAHVAGDEQSLPVHARSERCRLAARRSAGVENVHTWARAGQPCHELRRLVLHDKPAVLDPTAS